MEAPDTMPRNPQTLDQRADELAESWTNGNRSHVVEEIMRPASRATSIALALATVASLADGDPEGAAALAYRLRRLAEEAADRRRR